MSEKKNPATVSSQDVLLVWLDGNIDEVNDQDSIKTISKFKETIGTVYTFTDVDKCVKFIDTMDEETTFIITSGAFGQTTVSVVHDKPQIIAIYIYCGNKSRHEQWANQWAKVKGVYTEVKPICAALKNEIQERNKSTISKNAAISSNDTSDEKITTESPPISSSGIKIESLDQLDPSFMYTTVLKKILLTIAFEREHFMDFIDFIRQRFVHNTHELQNIKELEQRYSEKTSVWWYTKECFLYRMVNYALRTVEVNVIVKSGFFICDLHRQLAQLHSQQFGRHNHTNIFIVYRGQGLSKLDLDCMSKTIGGLVCFNSFLTTFSERQISLGFVQNAMNNPDLVGVLFVMTIDPSIKTTPFAKVSALSYFPSENEILFSTNSIFRIEEVREINENEYRLWEVKLSLTSDDDPRLRQLTDCIREEIFPKKDPWYQLGELLIKMGQFDEAQHVYESLLSTKEVRQRELGDIYRQLSRVKEQQGDYESAVAFSEKGLEIVKKSFSSNSPEQTTFYIDLGSLNKKMGVYSKALTYYEKALEIQQQTLPPDHSDLPITYNYIGSIYEKMGQYSKALSFHEKAYEIQKISRSTNSSNFATTNSYIGFVYEKMGEYSKALSSHERAYEIQKVNVPSNHPSLATAYSNLGSVYEKMGDYPKALSYYEKALSIQQKSLLSNHPDLAASYNNIGSVYENMNEYSKALSYEEKALQIQQKSLPINHPDVAVTYNYIGSVYVKKGEHMNALTFQAKAFKIFQTSLPPNHPDLANSYNLLGKALNMTGEYPKALSAHEKALDIQKKSLSENHPSLAESHQNIGRVYTNMGNYSKALSFYERALDVGQNSLPSNHPSLLIYQKDLKDLKKKM
uniref:Tetratricopeptide 2-like protein n=1 Tax=Adineta vaga TaxID=104782 RepID=B3G4I3_ADIVA|nr:tetratricopeptide 2-like protein [Adineta vaga]